MSGKEFIKKTNEFSKKITTNLGKKLIVFDELPSTNIKAKELAKKGEKEGVTVICRTQKQGRGRFERIWESPEGGIYLSIILRPKIPLEKGSILPLLAALAISRAINSKFNLDSKIKWPNDVRVGGKKIAGILLESEMKDNKLDFVILGIGINVNTNINKLSAEIRDISTSISYEIGDMVNFYDFLAELFKQLDHYYNLFLKKKYDIILDEWKKLSDTLQRKIKIITQKGEITGKAIDIDKSGFLIVLTDSKNYKTITSGDCIYIN